MDPRNPNGYSSSYLGLLHSQQGSVYHENFRYESFHESGESEIPAFSSQETVNAPTVNAPVRTQGQGASGVRHRWTPADDEVLISAWLNTSKDTIVGNEQKASTFWSRVLEYYVRSPHGAEDGEKREENHCKKRWHIINDQVNKFCAAYSAAERQVASGESGTDLLKNAHDIFFSDHDTKFNLEHAWCVLRFEQKWLSLNTPKAPRVSKRKNVSNTQTSCDEVFVESRPEGVKAAKAKKNMSGKGKSVAEYAEILEMKKEDMDKKERLSKFAVLDTLLARGDTLSEAEEVVKNKLLAELF